MSFTFRYDRLGKNEKQWTDRADEQTAIDLLSEPASRPWFAHIHDILCDLYKTQSEDGGLEYMNRDRMAFFMMPFVLFGKDAGYKLFLWRKDYWEQRKAAKGTKVVKVDRMRGKELEDFINDVAPGEDSEKE